MTILSKRKRMNSKEKNSNFSDNREIKKIIDSQIKKNINKKSRIKKDNLGRNDDIIHEQNIDENSNEKVKQEIIIRYKIGKDKNKFRLFGNKFYKNNKDKCK